MKLVGMIVVKTGRRTSIIQSGGRWKMSKPFNCSICKHLVNERMCTKFNTVIQHPLSIHKPVDFCSYYEEKDKPEEYEGVDEYA